MTNNFVVKLEHNLKKFFPSIYNTTSTNKSRNTTKLKLLLAVSGGADSVAMLCAFVKLQEKLGLNLSVLTVNHNLRAKAETDADAFFVVELCKTLAINCCVAELSGKKIQKYAKLKKCGIEASARHFRYATLYKKLAEIGADFIVTAHNQNDYYETVLMRLFQGGNPENLNAIKPKRKKLLRPLLNFSRAEILAFLKAENQNYCTDSTNASTKYLRNRIRIKMIPVLDEAFPNWQKGLDKTLEKIACDCNALDIKNFLSIIDVSQAKRPIKKLNSNEVEISVNVFQTVPKAIRRRLLLQAFSLLSLTRLSHNFIKNCVSLKSGSRCEIGRCGVHFSDRLIVYKKTKPKISGFSLWVDKIGEYTLPFGVLNIINDIERGENWVYLELHNNSKNANKTECFGSFELPFYIRSVFPGDKIQIGENTFKSVKKVLSECGVKARSLLSVAVIENQGFIKGIWGELAGGKNRLAFRMRQNNKTEYSS